MAELVFIFAVTLAALILIYAIVKDEISDGPVDRVRRVRADQVSPKSLPADMELARLRQIEAAGSRLAAELQRIINCPQSAALPLEVTGSARYALANWRKHKREMRHD